MLIKEDVNLSECSFEVPMELSGLDLEDFEASQFTLKAVASIDQKEK